MHKFCAGKNLLTHLDQNHAESVVFFSRKKKCRWKFSKFFFEYLYFRVSVQLTLTLLYFQLSPEVNTPQTKCMWSVHTLGINSIFYISFLFHQSPRLIFIDIWIHCCHSSFLFQCQNCWFEKFEVSPVLDLNRYKFCQTKEYLFMIFFCFIQKPEGYFYDSS